MTADLELTVDQLQEQIDDVLEMVEIQGMTIEISMDGQVVAVLLPVQVYEDLKAIAEDDK